MLNVPPMIEINSKMMLAQVMVLGCFRGTFLANPTFFPLKKKGCPPWNQQIAHENGGLEDDVCTFWNGCHLSRLPQLHQIYPYQKYGLIEGLLIIGFPE